MNWSTSDVRTDPVEEKITPPLMLVRPRLVGVERHASEMNMTLGMPEYRRASCTLSLRLTAWLGLRVASDSSQYPTYSAANPCPAKYTSCGGAVSRRTKPSIASKM